ncbi:MAG: hypothetical protein JGK23_10345 [Microcoleus sp. PH2017_19_SFW_U_A]|nr:hypothetical protein [Microcoleus sp. PH2017_19_SFW_U_A]
MPNALFAQFPIPNSQFPIPNYQLPITNYQCPIPCLANALFGQCPLSLLKII